MDETMIVIMLKEKITGFLDREMGCYKIVENDELITNAFASELENGKFVVTMKITCDREVADWEYDAIYDYYDIETISPFVTSIEEEAECYNPTWRITFDFSEDVGEMEDKICNLLRLHQQELSSVYQAIADKRDEYISDENISEK